MSRLIFYFRYAYRNLSRSGRWTTLAILAIAAGVATVVALRSLGLAIGDSLVDNVRITNKGDILITGNGGSAGFNFDPNNDVSFSQSELNELRGWAAQNNALISAFTRRSDIQVAAVDFQSVGRPQFVTTLFIDPQSYPPSHDIVALEPPDVPLSELFTGEGNEVVVSENLASVQHIQVGDTVRISNTEEVFMVRGIVRTDNEASVNDPFAAFFGFAYFDQVQARDVLDLPATYNAIAIALPEGTTAESIEAAERDVDRLIGRGWEVRIRSTPDLIETYEDVSQILSDFIVTLGLGALLIGGVGIMNTMLVMVRRRTEEIAALKTFGLKGRQVALLFTSEALLLGLAGTLIGMVLGVLFAGVVNSYGETFLQQQLVWRVYPEALLYGFALGMIFAVIFGVAPILTAVKVRPGIILRPNENYAPALGILQSLGLLVFVTLSIGLIVGQIISPSTSIFLPARYDVSPYLIGVVAVAGTFLFLGVMVGLLWILVWLVGKMPSFGQVDLRLALRNLSTGRIRTALTLLALSAGMFALSSITFVGQGTRELLNVQLIERLGGNVLVIPLPLVSPSLVEQSINNVMERTIGDVASKTRFASYDSYIALIDNQQIARPQRAQYGTPMALAYFAWNSLQAFDSDNPSVMEMNIVSGRNLTPDDYGKRVIVGPAESAAMLGIQVGSMVTYNVAGEGYTTFEVVGLATGGGIGPGFVPVTIPGGAINVDPEFQFFSFLVDDESLNEVLVELSSIPLIFPLDVSFIDQFLGRLIDQFAAIPTVVGGLSLLAAAVIMANTVALGTLERRRQIGILKAVGLKGRRVLVIMLIETTIVGLLSAIIGLGLSSVIVTLMTSLGGLTIPLPADARLTAVALVIAAVAIGWISTFLSARVAVGERVLNVLRYE